jgi:peptide subunit release factor 1 (eRF1)
MDSLTDAMEKAKDMLKNIKPEDLEKAKELMKELEKAKQQ